MAYQMSGAQLSKVKGEVKKTGRFGQKAFSQQALNKGKKKVSLKKQRVEE